jgi:hypothetical protein
VNQKHNQANPYVRLGPHKYHFNKQATTQYVSPVYVEAPQLMGSLNTHNIHTLLGTVLRTSSIRIRNYTDGNGETATGGNFLRSELSKWDSIRRPFFFTPRKSPISVFFFTDEESSKATHVSASGNVNPVYCAVLQHGQCNYGYSTVYDGRVSAHRHMCRSSPGLCFHGIPTMYLRAHNSTGFSSSFRAKL